MLFQCILGILPTLLENIILSHIPIELSAEMKNPLTQLLRQTYQDILKETKRHI